jgi:hypothetical protein
VASAAYYCDYANKRTLEPLAILGSIVHSLLQDIDIPESVQALIEKSYSDGTRVPQPQELLPIIKIVVETCFDSVILVIDGIDEIKEEERRTILYNLKDILKFDKVVKLLISSRNDDIQSVVQDGISKYRILVSHEKIKTDINDYVQYAVSSLRQDGRLAIRDPNLEGKIVEALIDGAKGM